MDTWFSIGAFTAEMETLLVKRLDSFEFKPLKLLVKSHPHFDQAHWFSAYGASGSAALHYI